MIKDQIKILDLLAEAPNNEKLEKLLNLLINDASFEDILEIRSILNERIEKEKIGLIKQNYWKALEFLE